MIKNIVLGALLPAILVVSGIGIFLGLQAPPPPKTALPQPVAAELLPFMTRAEVAVVKDLAERSETLDIAVSGTVVPFREIQLAAEVGGRIIEKNPRVRSGNYVKKGEVLYRVDPRDYELEVERLTRRRDQELASIKELQQDIANANALLKVAEQELQLAEADVDRFEKMNASFSSAAELDQAKRSRLTAMNQFVTLQNQISTLNTRQSRLELQAKLAETELDRAELDLERTVIRAPVDGRIVSEQAEADSYVARGAGLAIVEDTEKVEVACNVRMDQLFWILDQPDVSADRIVNAAAQFSRYELPPTPVNVQYEVAGRETLTYQWEGVLDRFDGAGLDPQSRTVPIRIRVDNPSDFTDPDGAPIEVSGPPMLVRGMFVNATIKTQPSTRLLLVPKLSIKPSSGASVIWKFTPDADAVFATPTAIASLEAAKEEDTSDDAEEDGSPGKKQPTIDPAEWQTGYLTIVEGVRMVASYWDNQDVDYWVCEIPAGQLEPGDFVITTPLPGVKADGTDPVRVDKKSINPETGKLAGTNTKGNQS